MLIQLIIGGFIIALTVVFHAFALDFTIKRTRSFSKFLLRHARPVWKVALLVFVVLSVTAALIVEIWIWAVFYMMVDAFQDWESALYFSISSFTTVGFGDIVLDKDWRLISSIEATNGFILFGWSTAFIFEVVSNIYSKEGEDIASHKIGL